MSDTKIAATDSRSLAKGVIAGLIGGVAGTVVKRFAERLLSPQSRDEAHPHAGADPSEPSPETIRWVYGAAVGAAYGAVAEFYPAATAKEGASFGLVLQALSREETLPAASLAGEAKQQGAREQPDELTAHIAYGIATELVRSLVRRCL